MSKIPRHIHWQSYFVGMEVYNPKRDEFNTINDISDDGTSITVGSETYPWGNRLYHSKEDYIVHKRCTDKSMQIYESFFCGSIPKHVTEDDLNKILDIINKSIDG